MTKTYTDLQLRQLDERLRPLRAFANTSRPRSGWIRAVRRALGMTQPQLAARLGLTRQSLNDLEQAEAGGRITLESLERVAKALGCRLSYAIVPAADSLVATRALRAEDIADRQLKAVSHSMKLEAQGVTEKEIARQRKRLVDELLRDGGRKMWR
jgi:predicted DNA-binding mobile mystery protein A